MGLKNIFIIGSLTKEEEIRRLAQCLEYLDHRVEYVKTQPDKNFHEIVKEVFQKIEEADLIIVVPKENRALGEGVIYEMEFASRVGTNVYII